MNDSARQPLIEFEPKHDYFVGIDSDGCVFDSMELKHKECFIPNIIKYWDLQPVAKYARQTAEFVNLYSHWRGTNRFPALVKTFELLKRRPEVRRRKARLPDTSALERFIESGVPLGNPSLKEAVEKSNDPVLRRALEWSEAVNRDVREMVKGLPPFPYVRETLQKLQGRADVIVVSATPGEALRREWREHDLDRYVALIAGQELGTKGEQLGMTAKGKYPASHMLMVGDALGDLTAARSVGALFYPIVPGSEEESWERFYNGIVDTFLQGKYTAELEAELLTEFERALPKQPPFELVD